MVRETLAEGCVWAVAKEVAQTSSARNFFTVSSRANEFRESNDLMIRVISGKGKTK
jgi:hypothetical protein